MADAEDIMLDIETLGTTPGSIVLSIGACAFTDTDITSMFHVHIDSIDSQQQGLHIDASTVMWWLDQSKEAQTSLTASKTVPLREALERFSDAFNWTGKRVWCNGAAFDFPILGAAFKAVGMKPPWAFYNEMDFRTIKGLVGKKAMKGFTIPPTIAHDGLADAIGQAKTLQMIFAGGEGVTWKAAA